MNSTNWKAEANITNLIVTGSGRRRVSVNSQIQGVGVTYLFVLVDLLIYSGEIKDYSRMSSADKRNQFKNVMKQVRRKQSNCGFQGRDFLHVSGPSIQKQRSLAIVGNQIERYDQ